LVAVINLKLWFILTYSAIPELKTNHISTDLRHPFCLTVSGPGIPEYEAGLPNIQHYDQSTHILSLLLIQEIHGRRKQMHII